MTVESAQLAASVREELLADQDALASAPDRDRVHAAIRRRGAGLDGAALLELLRAVEADLRRYLRFEAAEGAGWATFGLELSFGFETPEGPSLPALELGDGPDRVRIRGMIDRVDVDGRGHALVRDYKSGAPRSDWPAARWAPDQRLQVALYLIAVRELTGLDPVAGFYQPLRGDDLRGRGMFVSGSEIGTAVHGRDGRPAEEFAAELDAAGERAVALAAALRSGAVTPCPQSCSRDGCAFPGICRSQ